MLHILDGGQLCPLFIVVLIMVTIGYHIADERARRWAVVAAVLAFFAYGSHVWDALRPSNAQGLLNITVRTVIAAGITLGTGLMTFPLLHGFIRHFISEPARRAREAHLALEAQQRRQQQEEQRRADEERRRQPLAKPIVPTLTREERATSARQKYDETVRMLQAAALEEFELSAALRTAKKQYLREIDEAMK